MACALSWGLHERVVRAVLGGGLSRNKAAARFGVTVSTANLWVKRFQATGSLDHGQIGGHKPATLSGAHRDWLLARCQGGGSLERSLRWCWALTRIAGARPIALIPTLHHRVVNAHDRFDNAARVYAGLGVTLTLRAFHTLGSANHLATGGTDDPEPIGRPAGSARRNLMEQPAGLNDPVFATEDATGLHRTLDEAGVAATPQQQVSRPVALPAALAAGSVLGFVG